MMPGGYYEEDDYYDELYGNEMGGQGQYYD